MELRLLSTEADRREFARHLADARKSKGGFVKAERSLMREIHLAYGSLYALFDEQGPAPDEMIAGFGIHDLATFSQSYPKPDLTGFPPESVIECGELWAAAAGAARVVRHAGSILMGLLEAQALLIYPVFKPWNLCRAYKAFERAGDPIAWPYAHMAGGEKIWVQPMVLSGSALNNIVQQASSYGFEAIDRGRHIFFDSPWAICMRNFERRYPQRPTQPQPSASHVNLAA